MSIVLVVRIKASGETNPLEVFEGELVDSKGVPQETPVLGRPIYLLIKTKKKRRKKIPWDFRTAPVVEIALVDPGFWEVMTNDGQIYSIDPERVYH